ncbi:hypothetical protein QE390_003316 [Siphonobacter sp. SORGH_AS 1065]|nr:hypothetical protein [Siphonobacter sp. SORGH_AS_1065]
MEVKAFRLGKPFSFLVDFFASDGQRPTAMQSLGRAERLRETKSPDNKGRLKFYILENCLLLTSQQQISSFHTSLQQRWHKRLPHGYS